MSQNERVHFKIALPVDLKSRLEHDAVDNRRSLSAEIIHRLECSFSLNDEIAHLRNRDQENEAIINRLTSMVQDANRAEAIEVDNPPAKQAPLNVSQRDALLGGFEALNPDFQKALLGFVDQLVKQEALKQTSDNKEPKP